MELDNTQLIFFISVIISVSVSFIFMLTGVIAMVKSDKGKLDQFQKRCPKMVTISTIIAIGPVATVLIVNLILST